MRDAFVQALIEAPRLLDGPHPTVFCNAETLPGACKRLLDDGYLLEDVTVAQFAEGHEARYHFVQPEAPRRLTLRVLSSSDGRSDAGEDAFPTVSHLFPGADWHEREAMDFFPVRFERHPNPIPLLMPDDMADHKPLSREEAKRASLFDIVSPSEIIGAPSAAELVAGDASGVPWPTRHVPLDLGTRVIPYGQAGDFYTRNFQTVEDDERLILNMGPQHPSTHGVLRIVLELDGEYIARAEPVLGYIHRMHELMGQNRKAGQYLPNMGRVDYLHALAWNHALVLAVEELAGIEVPERAELLRILTVELNRISSHLLWWGAYLLDLGAFTPIMYGFDDRERIMDLLQLATGSRLTYCYFRFGGVSHEPMDGFFEGVAAFLKDFKAKMAMYEDLVTGNLILRERVDGIGDIDLAMCRRYGCTGPVIRGAGLAYDMRRAFPYSLYPELEFDIPAFPQADALARYNVRMAEMLQSVRIIEQTLERLPKSQGGHLAAKAPKQDFTLPKGEARAVVESARGATGVCLVSDGGKLPYRVKLRAPCFSNLSAFAEASRGVLLADAVSILGSLDLVIPEIDR